MTTKTAVITGATSRIMDALINKLIAVGYHIVAVSRKEKREESRTNVTWVVCDLSIPNQDLSFLKGSEILFHAAAISNYYNRHDYLLNNYQSTINLTNGALQFGVGKIVYISSIIAGYSYGDYGISKIKSEEYILKNFDNWLFIRPSRLYGYSKHDPIDSLIETIKKKRFVICPTGDKKGIYPLYYNDLANQIFELSIISDKTKSIQNIIGPKAYTYKGMIKEIEQTLGKKVIIVPIPRFLFMLAYHVINSLKLKIGIYPDQIYRFYHCHESTPDGTKNFLSLPDYLKINNIENSN
jgi:nucleoside-diphosphate-sugar epimerase